LPKNQSFDGAGAVLERREIDVFPYFPGEQGTTARRGQADVRKDFVTVLW
jgi:hypothetical protein